MSNKLNRHREIWAQKKILRDIYSGWYKQILRDLKTGGGVTIELGAGSGNFKEFKPDVTASDIEYCQWLDISFDAHLMPFKEKSARNMVMIDVLHHLADPHRFFHEAARVLYDGGRIVIIEPFPTFFSLFIYKRFHPEPFIMDRDYFHNPGTGRSSLWKKDPWEANQAMAYLLFFKYRDRFFQSFGDKFRIVKRKKMSCILYPGSGGFENKPFIPDFLIPLFKFFEILLKPFRWLLAFRCYIVLERK